MRRPSDGLGVLERPLELAGGKIRSRQEARFFADELPAAAAFELGRDPVGPCVLPDDGVHVRQASFAVPHHRRLALVGHAYGGQVGSREAGLGKRHPHDGPGAFEDLQRVVLNPSGPGQDLGVLQLVPGHLVAVVVEHDEACAARPLV